MNKTILSVITTLSMLLIFSFTIVNAENEMIIKVTSDKTLEFDMSQNGKTTKGLKTPYEFKFNEEKGHLIFKSKVPENKLKVSVELADKKTRLTAEWNFVVLMIENDKILTFGMD